MKSIIKKIIENNKKWSDPEYCLRAVKENGFNLKYVRIQTPEICLAAVEENEYALVYVINQTPEICLAAVKKNGLALEYARIQTPEICIAAVKECGEALQFVKYQTPEICCRAMLQSLNSNQYTDLSNYTIKKHGFFNYLKKIFCIITVYVYMKLIGEPFIAGDDNKNWSKWNDQKYCSLIAKHKSTTIKYVKNQTPEICLEAVWRSKWALQYVINQTPEICLAAIRRHWEALQFVRRQTPEICLEAIKQNPEACKYIRLPPDEEKEQEFLRELGLLLLAA